MNSEPELLSKRGDLVICQDCGTTFDAEGQIAARSIGEEQDDQTDDDVS